MTDFVRTDDAHFDALTDWDYEPNYHQWKDLRVHYVDEGPADGPVMLLVHGMGTWAYLYRTMIPGLVDAGYRCIAPDHLGFGRSDKPTDPNWYSIARHTEVLSSLICGLDLSDISVVCQDWGGPIGLAQPAMMPERFSRLVIMNTWLHHPEFVYDESFLQWIDAWKPGGRYAHPQPNIGVLPLLGGSMVRSRDVVAAIKAGVEPELEGEAALRYAGFSAPFCGLPEEGFNGARWFPLSIPVDNYASGNGAGQTMHYRALLDWQKDVHFVWGALDIGFNEEWGRTWAGQMGAPIDVLPDAGHFLQFTHGPEIVEHILRRARS